MRVDPYSSRNALMGKICLVTGGAQGIGWALTKLMAQSGTTVHCADISEQNLDQAARELSAESFKQEVILSHLDVTNRIAFEKWIANIYRQNGRIDILVNNAAFVRWTDVEEMTIEEAERSVRTCFDAMLYGVKTVIPLMRSASPARGHIVNMGSSAGLIFVRGPSAAYAAAKAAIEAYTQILRMELAGSPIHITLVRPGVVLGTDFFRKHVPSDRLPRIADFLPPARPEQVANAIVKAIIRRREILDVPSYLPLLYRAYALAPETFRRMVQAGGSARHDFSRVERTGASVGKE
jgi:NAD(P)-dependent dehydrogenase (short-subunit alcohol dehydrogenase family)